MRILVLIALLSGFQHSAERYDGWVSSAKVQDKVAIQAIYASLKQLKIPPGPLARSHGHWLIGIHLADKPTILKALGKRGFANRVVFSDDPVTSAR